MRIKYSYLLILLTGIASCSSSQKLAMKAKCPRYFIKNYTQILNEKYEAIYKNDSISYNEIRFECTNTAFLTHKVMFNKFGKWDKAIYPSNRRHPILMWENLDLFSDGKKYSVLTYGMEEWQHTYASVMVFDKKNNDLLSNDTLERENLTIFFADLIKKRKTKKKEFYEVYWKMVDPKHWENIKG